MIQSRQATTQSQLASPSLWLSQANTLRRAAALVYEELGKATRPGWRTHPAPYDQLALMKPFMLLSGLAIENVLKGVLILRSPEIATDIALEMKGAGLGKGGHGLERMAAEVAGKLSDAERKLLQRLEIFIVWGGRYPIPRRADDYRTEPTADGRPRARQFTSTDRRAIDKLFDRLVVIMQDEIAARPKNR